MRPSRPLAPLVVLAGLALASAGFVAPSGPSGGVAELASAVCADHEAEDATVTSRAADAIDIAVTVFRPCGADASEPVPVILHSHGWSGSRSRTVDAFRAELDAGFGVVSIDQRGHGESGGQANVQDPELEAQDILAVVDHVASLDWVRTNHGSADDPVLFAMGGSYGGGYQTITALTEIAETGATRFDALAPEITWYDLPRSLAPNDVVRSEWNTVLYASGTAMANPAPFIHEAFAFGSTTGQWPDGTILGEPDPTGLTPDIDAIFHAHSPVAFVEQGIHLDLPVLWRQGTTDTLFNLNEGLDNFTRTLTDGARERSVFVGYNGGHVLPTLYPSLRNDGALSGADTCSASIDGGWSALRLEFFRAVATGVAQPDDLLRARHGVERYNLMTDDGEGCVRLDALPERQPAATGVDAVAFEDAWLSTTGAGAAVHLEVPDVTGPARIAGIPTLSGEVTGVGVDQRILFGLSRGTSPADAQLIQSNLMPLRVALPGEAGAPFELELAGVAVELDEGEKLFLTVTPLSEQFYGHGSQRTPGALAFTGLELGLPIVGD